MIELTALGLAALFATIVWANGLRPRARWLRTACVATGWLFVARASAATHAAVEDRVHLPATGRLIR